MGRRNVEGKRLDRLLKRAKKDGRAAVVRTPGHINGMTAAMIPLDKDLHGVHAYWTNEDCGTYELREVDGQVVGVLVRRPGQAEAES